MDVKARSRSGCRQKLLYDARGASSRSFHIVGLSVGLYAGLRVERRITWQMRNKNCEALIQLPVGNHDVGHQIRIRIDTQ
jgi:hypothetical protein